MKIKDSVKQAMDILHLETLRKHQIQPIDRILDGRDTMLVCPTGSGKSAIFQIPALVMAHKKQAWTLVVEPTISLMHDQVQKLKSLGIQAEYLTSSNAPKHSRILSKLQQGQLSFLYVTPERLESGFFRKSLYYSCPWLVVVDEAHCVLDWGYTFRRSYLQISYQQIGRAGRDGQKSRAMLLYHPDDIDLIRYILNREQRSEQVRNGCPLVWMRWSPLPKATVV